MNGGPRHLLATISDPMVVLRIEDGMVVDVNEALSRVTGCAKAELLGRPSRGLVVWLCPGSPETVLFDPLARGEAVSNLEVALRTRQGRLQVTQVSALPVDIDGQPHAFCTLRGGREPSRSERRIAVHVELGRLAERRPPWPAAAAGALEVLCQCLDWDAGVFWQVDPEVEALRCVATWHVPGGRFQALEEASRQRMPLPGEGPLGRAWLSRAPAWMADATADQRSTPGVGTRAAFRGWFASPVLANDRVAGMVELFSGQVRPPDDELLELGPGLGQHVGRLLIAQGTPVAQPPAGAPPDQARWPAGADGDPPALLRELAANVGRLNRLLAHVVESDRRELDPAPRDPGLPGGHRLGLTLKGVSERTGIPGATVRTWERRYGFLHPVRSASGYRMYREDDIARILTVKRLLSEGVRISDAAAIVGTSVRSLPGLPAEGTG